MHNTDIVFVDSNDTIVGSGSRIQCIEAGLATRISRIFILDSANRILLQQRLNGVWDQSAGGHVDVGETYHQAAIRELREEMGIIKKHLKLLGGFYTSDQTEQGVRNRFNRLYFGRYDGPVVIDETEVLNYCWLSAEELDKRISSGSIELTQGMLTSYAYLQDYLR